MLSPSTTAGRKGRRRRGRASTSIPARRTRRAPARASRISWTTSHTWPSAPATTYTVTHIFDEGPHVAYALADYGCSVNELQEANNYELLNLTVLPERDPDLVVTSLAARTPVYVDTSFSVTVTVQNQGQAPTTQVSSVAIYVDHPVTGPGDMGWANTATVPTLGAGESTTAIIVIPADIVTVVGSHALWAYADHTDLIEEDNDTLTGETNNAFGPAAFTAEWRPLPDLQVEGVTVQGATVDIPAREAITYTVRVKNAGPAASGSASLALFADPDGPPLACDAVGAFGFDTIPAIPAGGTVDVVVNTAGFTVPDTYNVWAFADYTCDMDEYQNRETNNQYALNVVVGQPRLADLRITNATVLPEEIPARYPFELTAHVQNDGTRSSLVTAMAVYTHTPACDDSDWLAWTNAPALAAGAYGSGADVTLPEITLNTPGDYTLHLMADYRCDEEELVETNNVFTKTITIGPPLLPDLVIAAVTTEPATGIAEGDWVTVTAVVSNTGYIASEEVSLAVYTGLSAPGCGAGNWDNVMTVAPIEAGAAATIVVPGIVFDDQGTQHLYSFIDYNCYGDELDHTNNIDDRTFTILPPLVPDLAIVSFTADTLTPFAEEDVNYTLRIQNQGTGRVRSIHLGGGLLRPRRRAGMRRHRRPGGAHSAARGRADGHRHHVCTLHGGRVAYGPRVHRLQLSRH